MTTATPDESPQKAHTRLQGASQYRCPLECDRISPILAGGPALEKLRFSTIFSANQDYMGGLNSNSVLLF